MTRVALCAAAAGGLLLGWWVFWFQCDDAYIAFRYVSASQLGWGYTWNPPPFRPVEGYTSFLWVVLLDAVWRLFGWEPPESANWLALAFSAASLALVVMMVLRLRLSPGLARWRTPLLGLVLLGVVSNRTFLAWTSSGLETALFGFLLLLWVFLAVFGSGSRGSLAWLSLSAGLLALARPDGLLFAAATAAILLFRMAAAGALSARALAPALPLLIPVAHVLWRRARYGYWVPNTYYAKLVAAWPEAGLRYFAAFLLEYAFWIWLALALVAGFRWLRGGALAARLRAWDAELGTRLIVGAALALHFAYYTLRVGGDHFEFRVYQHWVPLALVSFAVVAEQAGLAPRRALAALAAMLLIGWPLPWLHWWHTRNLTARAETFKLHYRVSPLLPAPVRWYGSAWDELEGWLIRHLVGLRHQEHKIFGEVQVARFPSREEGARISADGHPVLVYHTIGVPGWVLPNVAVLDWFGLNDAVIAHSRPTREASEERQMAHDRGPPPGYFECFRPNVFVRKRQGFTIRQREQPLTAGEIRACEEKFLARASS
jgi:arabinofuranosyltransferase